MTSRIGSAFNNRVVYLAIMNYDVWGSWSGSVGPNAPLDDSCAPTQAGSAASAVKAWTGAQFPANKVHSIALLRYHFISQHMFRSYSE